ncbi:hypothetical protein L218DRAFT_944176 [Marasmius fiardii PR-910]|nr:hypothetical protein L218DRAFT_944176 [Marasmius fiardii PR-910]
MREEDDDGADQDAEWLAMPTLGSEEILFASKPPPLPLDHEFGIESFPRLMTWTKEQIRHDLSEDGFVDVPVVSLPNLNSGLPLVISSLAIYLMLFIFVVMVGGNACYDAFGFRNWARTPFVDLINRAHCWPTDGSLGETGNPRKVVSRSFKQA